MARTLLRGRRQPASPLAGRRLPLVQLSQRLQALV